MINSNWFAILGVNKEADIQDIRTAYKKLVLIHHPGALQRREEILMHFEKFRMLMSID